MNKLYLTPSLALAAITLHSAASAADDYKADNATPLNAASSWTANAVPGASGIAVWDATVSAANTTNSLGANTTWAGIKILNPGGPVQINAGYNLTNGASGIDLSAATQDLILSNNVVVTQPEDWNVAAGRTLTVGGLLIKSPGGVVRFGLADSTASVALTNPPGALLQQGSFIPFGTVNDTDFAALNGSGQVAAGSSVLSYLTNPSGNFKSTTGGVVDFTTTAPGLTLNGNSVVAGIRINQPNPAYPAWTINTGGKVLSLGALLVTPNAGSQPVYVNGSGSVRIYGNELILFQNNPAAPVVFQSPTILNQYTAGAGLTKVGAGTVEIQSGSTYTGGTKVYEGTLAISGGGTLGAGPLNVYGGNFAGVTGATNYAPTLVYAGATQAVRINTANGQFVQATNLTLSAGAHLLFAPTNGVNLSPTVAPLVITNANTGLYASNAVTVDIAGSPAPGQYPLIKYGTLGANGFGAFSLNTQPHITAYLSNNTLNASVDLVVTANHQPLKWAAGSGTWDIGTTANWKDTNGVSTPYQQNGALGDAVVLEDSASGSSPLTITLNNNVTPASVSVSATKNYTLTGNGGLGGSGALTQSGTGTLTLQTTNTFTGGLFLNGGTTVFSTLNNLGSGTITFSGGGLKYSANTDDLSTRTVTLGAGGATIDDNGNNLTFASAVGNGGAGGLTKLGSGTLTLLGTNLYYGNTVIGAGTLALGSSGYLSNSAAIVVSSGATLDVSANPLTLQNQILAGSGTLNGNVTNAAGATITPATNGVAGTLTVNNGDLTVIGGTLAFDLSTTAKDALVISGNLNLTSGTLALNVSGSLTNGTYKLIQYTGSLSGGAASLNLTGFSQSGKIASLSDAISGEIDLVVKAQSGLSKVWQGDQNNSWDVATTANWRYNSTVATYAEGDNVTFNDTAAQTYVSLQAAVNPASVTVSNNTTSYTLADGASGSGKISGATGLVKNGSGTLVVDAINNNSGATVINGGTLQVGDGGNTGDLGTGNITNRAALVFAQTDNRTVTGVISGTGTLTQQGSATLTLAADSPFSGQTIINSGTLQVGAGGSTGSLGASPVTDNGVLVIDRAGTLTLTNTLTGSGTVISVGSGTVTLAGTSAWLGDTSISNGVVKLGGSEKIPDTSTVSGATGVVNLEGTLDLNGFNETVNALSGSSGVVSNSAATSTSRLVIGYDSNSSATFGGTLADGVNGGKVQLVKQGTNTQTLNTYNAYSGGTILSNGIIAGPTVAGGNAALLGSGPVTFYGGTLQLGGYAGSATVQPGTFANPLVVPAGQTGALLLPQRGDVNSPVSGGGTFNLTAAATRGNVGGNWSAFTGVLNVASKSGSSDDFRLNNATGFPNARVHLGAGVNLYNLVSGAIIPVGELSGETGSYLPLGSTGSGGAVAAVWLVGGLNTSTNFAGAITDTTGLIKDGTGSWTLTGTNTYSGITAVTNGTLVLANDNAASPNTAAFDLRSGPARLDVTGLTASTLSVTSTQALQGVGTVLGNVSVAGTLAPGISGKTIGNLKVSTQVTLAGTAIFKLNRANAAAAYDSLTAQSVLAGGTLIVTNLGPDLVTGTKFQLFSVPVTGSFDTVTLPTANASGTLTYTWNNQLAVDGSLVLLSGAAGVNTNATTVTSSFSNGALTLSWPGDHTGWRLQVQTNALGTHWVDVANSTATNLIVAPFNATNQAVFYRLVYP